MSLMSAPAAKNPSSPEQMRRIRAADVSNAPRAALRPPSSGWPS